METRTRVFRFDGTPLDELPSLIVDRSWVLNGTGVATFEIAKSDSKATEENLRFGNRILVEHDRAGAWCGFIWTPQDWYENTIKVTCYDPVALLKHRYSDTVAVVTGTSDDTINAIVELANKVQDTGIRVGSLQSRTQSGVRDFSNMTLYDAFIAQTAWGQCEWEFVPDTSTGKLLYVLNTYQRMGLDRGKILEQGHNIANKGVILSVQGDIVNTGRVMRKGTSSNVIEAADAVNETSQGLYGIRQGIQPRTRREMSADMVAALIANYAYPRSRYTATAIDVDNTFDFLRLGDVLRLKLQNFGFVNGSQGTFATVRVMGREFMDYPGDMSLVLLGV